MPVSFGTGVETEDERCPSSRRCGRCWSRFCDRRRNSAAGTLAGGADLSGWVERKAITSSGRRLELDDLLLRLRLIAVICKIY